MVGQGVRRSPGLKLGKPCVDGLTGRRQADGQAANAEGFAITSVKSKFAKRSEWKLYGLHK